MITSSPVSVTQLPGTWCPLWPACRRNEAQREGMVKGDVSLSASPASPPFQLALASIMVLSPLSPTSQPHRGGRVEAHVSVGTLR